MSDPVSNAEIEDVLSSIRRLVSDDPSPLNKRKRIAEGVKERFVLTPALRVAEDAKDKDAAGTAQLEVPETAESPQDATPAEDPVAEVSSADADRFAHHRQSLEQRIAELESALQQAPDEWEPDGSEVAQTGKSSIPSFADAPDMADAVADAVADEVMFAALEQPEETDSEPDMQADDADVEADQPDELLDAAQPEDKPDAPIEDQFDVDAITALLKADSAEEKQSAWLLSPDTDDDDRDNDDPDAPEGRVESETWDDLDLAEPGQVENIAEQATTADAEPELEPNSESDDAIGDDVGLFSEDSVLDEAALREMVAQLVREELQGVLGERITRNVRRLVRREIQRALAVQELE